MTRIEALSILGNPEATLETVRSAYRKASFRYHPDRGGDIRQMQLVNAAWELLGRVIRAKGEGKSAWGQWHYNKADEAEPLTESIMKVYNAIKHLPGINIELVGCWLWVSGDTKAVKDSLKNAGFRWNRKRSKWSWHGGTYHKRSKRHANFNHLRAMYGATNLDGEELDQVA